MTLQAKYDSSHTALTLASRDVERELELATDDLEMSKSLVTQLQNIIATTKHDLDTTTNNLKMERQTSTDLHIAVQTVNKTLKENNSKMNFLADELKKTKLAALESEQSVDAANKITSTHKLMLEESKSNLMTAGAEIKKLSKANKATTAENLDFRKKLEYINVQLLEKTSTLQNKQDHIINLENNIKLNWDELEMKASKINEVRETMN